MLPRPAYLTLCRSIQLLVLLARGDAAKELEILGVWIFWGESKALFLHLTNRYRVT